MGRHYLAQLIDCAPLRNPKIRGKSLASVAAVALSTLALPCGMAQGSTATSMVATQAVQAQNPLSELSFLLEMLIRLMGGNPEELSDTRLSLTTKLNIVRGFYETNGIPEGLSPGERQELLDTVFATHLLIRDPLIVICASEKAVLLFDASLHDMWHDLEGPGPLLP